LAQFGEDFGNPHNGHSGQIEIEIKAGLDHSGTAETAKGRSRRMLLHAPNQMGRVKITARFTDGKEQSLTPGFRFGFHFALCHNSDDIVPRCLPSLLRVIFQRFSTSHPTGNMGYT
jgi:hypothetical protein